MCMPNENRDAEHSNRLFSFDPNAASIAAFCRPPNFWDAPTSELDMFSRWIRLCDRALAANQDIRERMGSRRRRKCKTISAARAV
jgi:hypothetical protein